MGRELSFLRRHQRLRDGGHAAIFAGGGAAPWTPAERELALWLRAGDYSIPAGPEPLFAAIWLDSSGNFRHATLSAQSVTPAPDDAGGFPSWPGGAAPLTTPSFGLLQPCTIYGVVETVDATATMVGGAGSGNLLYRIASSRFTVSAGSFIQATTAPSGAKQVFVGVYNGASGRVYVSSGAAPEDTGNVGTSSALGGLNVGSTGYVGTIRELVVTALADSPEQVAQMFAYLEGI